MIDRASRWGLRVLALVGAVVVWWLASVEQRERLSERLVDVSVSYNTPAGLILLDPVQTVKVRLRGPDSRVRRLSPSEMAVVVDVTAGDPGARVVLLGESNVALPEDVEVTSIEPNSLTIRVDREVSVQLPVVPRLVGEPAGGAVPGDPISRPEKVRVSGPEGIVSGLAAVATSPISLDGHALSFFQAASVVSPDPLVRIVEPSFVNVQIPMSIPELIEPDQPAKSGRRGSNR